ncbi:MAG: hypothetical protein LBJ12_00445 [Oscillospiraceae bacterium]|jgi:hypothetical protein|nr:hypothetical protein [Oscillospiraceae bacterium]
MRKFLIVCAFIIVLLLISLACIVFVAARPESGMLYTRQAEFALREWGTHLNINLNASFFQAVGYIGSDDGNKKDAGVIFRPTVPEDGLYYLVIHYFSGSSDRYLDLTVNGDVLKIPCAGDNWRSKRTKRIQIQLKKGRNTLRFGCKDWYAPNLDKISIEEGATPLPPASLTNTPDIAKYEDGGITLTLDRANGTYSVVQDGRELLQDAFCAATIDGRRVYAQDYETHTVAKSGNVVTFEHKKAGAVTLVQEFTFKEGCLLTNVTAYGGSSNWIAPIYTLSYKSLTGGTEFLEVPFDNDGYANFTTSDANGSGSSHELTALLNSETDSAVVIGSVTHDTWKTGIEWNGSEDGMEYFFVYGGAADSTTRDTQLHGAVSGDKVISPTILIAAFDDWHNGLDTYGKVNAAIAPPLEWSGNAPLGWSSWGVVQFGLNKDVAFAISDYYKAELQPVWQTDENDSVYINLDAGWQSALPTDEAAKAFVEHCAKNGQKAGMYYTPFACWSKPKELKGQPLYDALLRDKNGEILPAWDGAYAFDPTHPAVIEKIDKDLQSFLDAGFAYIKLDFISHGAMEGAHYDKSVQTGLQAYNKGMKQIADKVADKMFINLSIAPIFPHQYAHGRRMACDTFWGIGETKYMLNSLSFGFWEREIYACPDPDHIIVWGNDNGRAEENEARARVTSGIILASFLEGDAFNNPPKDKASAQKRFDLLLKNPDIMALAKNRTVFTPTEIRGTAANIYTATIDGKAYFAVFNFDNEDKQFTLPLPKGAKKLKELWSGKTLAVPKDSKVSVAGHDAKVFVISE